MNSKLKSISFKDCQHLKKIVIGDKVSVKGTIDLTDTPITETHSVYSDYENKEGFIATPNIINHQIKLKKQTSEIATQTDPVDNPAEPDEVDISKLVINELTDKDKRLLSSLCDNVFWYIGGFYEDTDHFYFFWDEEKNKGGDKGRWKFLLERYRDLKQTYREADSRILRTFAEHAILLSEKILTNVLNIERVLEMYPRQISHQENWGMCSPWIVVNCFDEITETKEGQGTSLKGYKLKELKELKKNVPDWTENDSKNIGEQFLFKDTNETIPIKDFYNTLNATGSEEGGQYFLLPVYDMSKSWEELTNYNKEIWCGVKKKSYKYKRPMSDDAYKSVSKLFYAWRTARRS